MLLGIEHIVRDAVALEKAGYVFGLVDGNGTDQDRLALFMGRKDLAQQRRVLAVLGLEHRIGLVKTDHRPVGRDADHIEAVDGPEFIFLGQGRACHAGQLLIHAEIVLEGDGRQSLVLISDFDAFLGFDGLVQAIAVAAAEHQAAREVIDDDDLAVFQDIVLVAVHDAIGPQGIIDMVVDFVVFLVGEVFNRKIAFRLLDTARRQDSRLGLLVNDIVDLTADFLKILFVVGFLDDPDFESFDQAIGPLIEVRRLIPHAGNDQRGARFIDQDAVNLVDDGKIELALHALLAVGDHIVAQVVKAEFVIGAIGDVCLIGGPALFIVEAMHDQAHRQAEIAVNLAHPFAVALSQVVVDGDHVDAFAGQGIEVDRQSRNQRFAFTGFHFGDPALVEDNAADDLDRVMFHFQDAPRCLADRGEGFRQDVVQRFASGQPGLEADRLALEVFF